MGVKPYQCPEPGCGAKFVRPGELKRHSLAHNMTSRFTCQVCDSKFNRTDQFKTHIVKCSQANKVGLEECLGKVVDTEELDEVKEVTGYSWKRMMKIVTPVTKCLRIRNV